ncbi:MAG: bifunctional phosphoribosylaminoimidazolecarboxamide formyltransferase/IMP cyclohydrolase, partial [Elusimicrobiota bacterium]|nr:bifunctional phosphoribosylaminoimidazolecarboxamide formyltransferase/IMP cyclohydrolase [Elusimicrobiota bacterium]
KSIFGGMLIQEKDVWVENLEVESKVWDKVVTERKPTEDELESLRFAWKVCKHVKSNAIVLSIGRKTVGIGAGQMSRIDALKVAIMKMKSGQVNMPIRSAPDTIVLASDAFFPFRDVVDEAAKIGVCAIVQPGGSLRDNESIAACNEHNIAMVFTGIRHFKH